MTEDHQHNDSYSANNTIVCSDCVTEENKNGNECYCKCHTKEQPFCSQCKVFHNF